MVITFVSGEYPPQPGGIGDYTQRLGEALVARGHRVYVVTIDGGLWTLIDVAADTRHIFGTVQRAAWRWRSWRMIDAALAILPSDVLHIQYQTGAYGMHPAINLLPWHLRRAARARIAVTMHDLLLPYLFPKAEPLRRWVTARLVHDVDAVVVTNADDYNQLRDERRRTNAKNKSASSNLFTIPIGSNIPVAPPPGYAREVWRAQLGVRADETLIAYFGLISRTKGLDVLLHTLAQLPHTTRLLVIGGAATAPQDRAFAAEIDAQLDALGLRPRVQITGHAAKTDVSAHLLAADIAALPFADGASLRRGSLLAALAHGVPVVTTGSGVKGRGSRVGSQEHASSSPAHLTDGEHALLVPPNDAQALAAAIAQLASDTTLRAGLGTNGQTFAQQFAWPSIAEAHEELYQRMLKESG